MSARRIGPRARHCIQHFEGLRLEAYRCPAGVWTIGYGSTRWPDGRPVRAGERITREQADALLTATLAPFEAGVAQSARADTLPREFGAMVSFAFNVGLAAFRRSSVLRHHNARTSEQAARSFRLWVRGGGRVLPGLVRRRQAEAALYLGEFGTFDAITEFDG